MAVALFAGEDYEEVATRLTETLASWARGARHGLLGRSRRPLTGKPTR